MFLPLSPSLCLSFFFLLFSHVRARVKTRVDSIFVARSTMQVTILGRTLAVPQHRW